MLLPMFAISRTKILVGEDHYHGCETEGDHRLEYHESYDRGHEVLAYESV